MSRTPRAPRHLKPTKTGRYRKPDSASVRAKFFAIIAVFAAVFSIGIFSQANATTVLVQSAFTGPGNGVAEAVARGWNVDGSKAWGCPNPYNTGYTAPQMVDSSNNGGAVDRLRLVNNDELCETGYALYDVAQTTSAGLDVSFNLSMSQAGGGLCPGTNDSYNVRYTNYTMVVDSYGALQQDEDGNDIIDPTLALFEGNGATDRYGNVVVSASSLSYADVQADIQSLYNGYTNYNGITVNNGLELWQVNQYQPETETGDCQADGVVFYLKDGSNNATGGNSIGEAGGSLGYSAQGGGTEGLEAGLLGIGFDAYGNFYQQPFGGTDCQNEDNYHDNPNSTYARHSLVIRGAQGVSRDQGYCRIHSTNETIVNDNSYVGSRNLGVSLPNELFTVAGRAIRIVIDPSDTSSFARGSIKIFVAAAGTSNWSSVQAITEFEIPAELAAASTFKFGFVAGTGGGTMNAELWGPTVQSVHPLTAAQWLTQPTNFCANASSNFDFDLQGKFGVAPYTFTQTAQALPSWLSLTSQGHLSGWASSTTAAVAFKLKLTDSSSPATEVDQPFTISIAADCTVWASSNNLPAPGVTPTPTQDPTTSAPQAPPAQASEPTVQQPAPIVTISATPTPSTSQTPTAGATASPSTTPSTSQSQTPAPAASQPSVPNGPGNSGNYTGSAALKPRPLASATSLPAPSAVATEIAAAPLEVETKFSAPVLTLPKLPNVLAPVANPAIGATGSDAAPIREFNPLASPDAAKALTQTASQIFALVAAVAIAGAMSGRSLRVRMSERARGRREESNFSESPLSKDPFAADKRAWGDRLWVWRLGIARAFDKLSVSATEKSAKWSPLAARVFNDGSYLRSMFGSLTIAGPIVSIALAVVSVQQNNGQVLTPPWMLLLAIAVIGLFDAFAGVLGTITFVVGTAIYANSINVPEDFRLMLAVLLVGMTPSLAMTAFRKLRKDAANSTKTWWERISDFAIAPFISGWTIALMISAMPAVAGLTLPVANHVLAFGVTIALAAFVRVGLEEFSARYYPARLDSLTPAEIADSPLAQKVISLGIRYSLWIFIAEALIGRSWQVWVGSAILLLPTVFGWVHERLPNSEFLWRLLPTGIPGLAFVLVIAGWTTNVLTTLVNTDAALAKWAFVIIPMPLVGFALIALFARHGLTDEVKPVKRVTWLYRLGGILMLALTMRLAGVA